MDCHDQGTDTGDNSPHNLPDASPPQESLTCVTSDTVTGEASTDMLVINSDRATEGEKPHTSENPSASQQKSLTPFPSSQHSSASPSQADIQTFVSPPPLTGAENAATISMAESLQSAERSPDILCAEKNYHSLDDHMGKGEKTDISSSQVSRIPDNVISSDPAIPGFLKTGKDQSLKKTPKELEAVDKDITNSSDGHSDNDMIDIISLSEEEPSTQFVITNVCSISEEDAHFEDKTDDTHSETAEQLESTSPQTSTSQSSPHRDSSSSDQSDLSLGKAGDADGDCIESGPITTCTTSVNSINTSAVSANTREVTIASASVTSSIQATPGTSSPKDFTVTDLSKMMDSSAKYLSKHHLQQNKAGAPSASILPGKLTENVASTEGHHDTNLLSTPSISAVSSSSSSLNAAAAVSRDAVNVKKKNGSETGNSSKASSSSLSPSQPQEHEAEPSECFTVKFEVEDTEYETGRNSAKGSTSDSVSGDNSSNSEQGLNSPETSSGGDCTVSLAVSEMQSSKRQLSEEGGSTNQIKKVKLMKTDIKGLSPATQVQLRQRLEALHAPLERSPSPVPGGDILAALPGGQGSAGFTTQEEGEKLHSMLIKPILVPANLISKWPASLSQSLIIPTKSMSINVPATLSRSDSSANPVTPPESVTTGLSPEKVAVKSPVTCTESVVTTSHVTVATPTLHYTMATTSQQATAATNSQVTAAASSQQVTMATSSQQLSQQLVSHLRHVQDKPGSYQMLTIPMPDGSSHNVKVVFAPNLQHQMVTTTSAVPQTLLTQTPSAFATSKTQLSPSSTGPTTPSTVPPSLTSMTPTTTSTVPPSVVFTASNTSKFPLKLPSQASTLSARDAAPLVLVTSGNQQFFTLLTGGNKPKGIQPSLTSASSQVLAIASQNAAVPAQTATIGSTANLPSVQISAAPTPNRQNSSGVKTIQASLVSVASALVSSVPCGMMPQGTKRDLRVDQVSADSKLSASDMAALIQGKNLIPYLEPTRRPGKGACNKVYRCVECGVMCCTLVGYTVHVKRMSMVIRYACMDCKAALVFFNKCTFLAHLRRHSASDTASGHVVNLKSYTMSVSSLPNELLPPIGVQHMDPLVINRNQSITCRECLQTLSDTSQLATHFGANATRCYFEHTCPHCNMELPSACSLKAHLRLHDEESHSFCARPNFVCPECGLVFANQASLYQHLFATCLHFSRCVNLRCPLCRQFHPTLAVLKKHLTTMHPNHHRYQCYLCKRTYHSLQSFQFHFPQLHRHLQDSQFDKDKMYQMTSSCHLCLGDRLEGEEHAQKHVQEEKEQALFGFACLFCQDTTIFGYRAALITHLAIRHNAYRFSCSICEQGFVTVTLLRIHVLCEHGSLQSQQQGAVMCGQCNASKLSHESVLPHVMWHVMKKLMDTTTPSDHHLNKCTEISVPKINALSGDRQKQMLMCRMCGHISLTRFALQRHMSRAMHVFCRQYSLCPFCQRFDFVNSASFVAHTKRCLVDSGVHSTIDITDDSQEDGLADRPFQTNVSPEISFTPVSGYSNDSVVVSLSPPSSLPRSKVIMPYKRKPSGKRTNQATKRPAEDSTSGQVDKLRIVLVSKGGSSLQQQAEGKGKKYAITKVSTSLDTTGQERPTLQDTTWKEEETLPAPYACHFCGLIYETASLLNNHITKDHGGEKNVMQCQLCAKKGKEVMMTRASLRKHLTRRHHIARPAVEAMIADTGNTLQGHAQGISDADASKQLTDSDSSASASSGSPVKRLKVAGGDGQDYVCASCSFASPNMDIFREHITKHWMAGWLQCPECGLCIRTMSPLCKHLLLVHKVPKPVQYLQQNSIRLDQLPGHILSRMEALSPLGQPEEAMSAPGAYHGALHADPPPSDVAKDRKAGGNGGGGSGECELLECTVCYKEFGSSGELQSHMRTHGMAFIRSRRLHGRHKSSSSTPSPTEQQDTGPQSDAS